MRNARTGISTLNGHISKTVQNLRFFNFWHIWVRFWSFFWVLEVIVGHFCPNMPLGVVKNGKKENLLAHKK